MPMTLIAIYDISQHVYTIKNKKILVRGIT
jgi:hypothetical protein